jgi:hypothetical protein
MPLEATRCPADVDEVAEAYCMGTLGAVDAAAFDEHLLACDECWAAVEVTDRYVRAMREAAKRLRRDSTGSLPGEPDAPERR